MSPHLVPKDKRGWQLLESSNECRQACINSVKQIQEGTIPNAFRGMSISILTGIFNAIMLSWPSMVLLINSIMGNSIDSVTLGHVKEADVVDVYTIRITYFKVINTFIMSNDNAKTIRLKAFLNKSEYKTSESPDAFASRLLLEQRDVNVLYAGPNGGEAVISQAMLKETFLDSLRRKTDKLYDNILDNIENENISFTNLVERINNKYMREKSRVVTESLYSVSNVSASSDGTVNKDLALYSTSAQTPIKRKDAKPPMDTLPCFQMRDRGKCDFGETCRFSHDQKVLKRPVSNANRVTEIGYQNDYLCEHLLYAQNSHAKYKKKYNSSKAKTPIKKAVSKKPAPEKFFEDVGKSNAHKVNLVVDGATAEEQVNEQEDEEYTSDGSVSSNTSESN
jgi:hypothetical protein